MAARLEWRRLVGFLAGRWQYGRDASVHAVARWRDGVDLGAVCIGRAGLSVVAIC